MIIYDLICNEGHAFEAWFRSLEDFEKQVSQALVSCPHCASRQVRRVPSAVHVATGSAPLSSSSPAQTAPSPQHLHRPDEKFLLKQLVDQLLSSSEDVGNRFAEEARRIHYEEVEARPIHGQASESERLGLQEEGISFINLPNLRPEDLN